MEYDLVIKAINEVLEEMDTEVDGLTPDVELRNIMDSMSLLEVLIILEEYGYETKFIKADEFYTIGELVEKVKKCKKVE